jgi:hypothetical protein
MKKERDDETRRLTLHRETIRRLEEPQLLKQVLGGTSQWVCTTTITRNNELSTDGC